VTTSYEGQFVVHRLGLAMTNLHNKFEVFMFTHYEDMKGNAKYRNWGRLGTRVTQGHWQCHCLIERIRLPIWLQ